MSEIEHNVEEQRRMYGEPLAEIFGRVTSALGISQAALARTLGISAPMLSQLGSGRRVKIGNPAALRRLEEVQQLVEGVRSGETGTSEVQSQLDDIREETSWSTTRHDVEPRRPPAGGAGSVGALLRAVADRRELGEAADLLEESHPGIAELLRVHGWGEPEQAAEHFRRHAGDVP